MDWYRTYIKVRSQILLASICEIKKSIQMCVGCPHQISFYCNEAIREDLSQKNT